MPRKQFTAEQNIGLLQAEVELVEGRTVGEVSRSFSCPEQI